MQETKTKGTPLRVDVIDELLDRPVEDEVAILEALTAALAKGQPHAELWQKLQDAAVRDDRTTELAFAFEKVLGDRRMKLFPTAAQAGAMLHAARWFVDRMGDADGARGHLERALQLQPTNAEASELLEMVLVQLGDRAGLSQLLATTAAHRSDPGEQLDLLRRAMKLLDGLEGQDDRAIKIGLALLKLEPGHAPTIASLEQRLGNAGKWADLARLLEQSLASPAADDEESAARVAAHRRLVEIYATRTNEIERATSHVEAVLDHDPADELAVSVAEKLLGHRASAGRAAAALERAYEAIDDDAGVARMLALQLDQNRGGPKRLEVQKRLAAMHATRLGDPGSAWPILEQLVIADPGDASMRKLLRACAELLGRQQDAAKLLSRASSLAKDPVAKALVAVEAARLLAGLGDSKRAAQQIAQVLETTTDATAQLEAARALAELIEGVSAGQLAAALETIADGGEGDEERAEAAERLATVAEFELEDLDRAIAAWRRLLGAAGERGAVARESLERLFEATERHQDLVDSLRSRARDEADPSTARAILLRAARVLSDGAGDVAAAAAILREIGERFGPARDLHDRLMPLLAALNAHAELASVLEKEVELASDGERPDLLVELGRVRLAELGDLRGALEAHGRAIALDPGHAAAQASLEAMLDTEIGLDAAIVLEPIYRRFGDDAGLVRALEARLAASVHRDERATLLEDLIALCEPTEPGRGLGFASAALALELDRRPPDDLAVAGALATAERLAEAGPGPGALAAELASALGDEPFSGSAAASVARRAAEAYDAAGRADVAIAMAQRAVAAAPDDVAGDILLDRLLAGRGDAGARLAAREEAVLRAGTGARRRDALLRLAAVAEEIGELARAADAYERIGADDGGDADAIAGLLRVYEAAGEWDRLAGALEKARSLAPEGEERRRIERRLAEARVKGGRLEEAIALYQELVSGDDDLPDASLGAAFALAARAERHDLAAAVLERRVLRARDDAEASRYAEALGELLRDRIGDAARAAEAFRTAASAAHDEDRAEAMWSRVIALAPDDREAAGRLVDLRSASGDFGGALDAAATTLRLADDPDEAARITVAMEDLAVRAGTIDRFLDAARATLARAEVAGRPELSFGVALARAHALVTLASEPEHESRADEASEALRALVEAAPDQAAKARAADELGHFVGSRLDDPRRWDDARAWFAAAVDLADGDARKDLLVRWARAEAQSFGALDRAIVLADRIADEFPEAHDARALRAEWLLASGDVERGVEALLELRVQAEGDARAAFERRAAALLLGRGKAAQAVDLLAARLDDDPTDGEALALALQAASSQEAAEAAGDLVERVSAGLDPGRRAQQLEALLTVAPTSPRRRGWLEDLLGCVEGPRAAQVAVRLAEEAADDDDLWSDAEERARALGHPDDVAAAYRRALEAIAARAVAGGALDADAVERLGQRAVDWQEEWFEDEDAAGALLLATLRAAPGATWAFERLKLSYNSAERWDDLFELYDLVLARTTDHHERVMLLDDAAHAARDFAQDGDRAIRYLEELAKLRPDDGRVASSLERLYERYGRWRDLIAMLWSRLDALGGRDGAKIAARVAAMWLDGAKDGEQALAAIERLEQLDPDSDRTIPLLERVAASPATASTSGAEPARQRAAARLEVLHRAAGRSTDLARALEILLEGSSGAERARRLKELVGLRRDALGDDDGAAAGLIELVRLEPGDPSHRQALVALAERTGRWDRLAEALETIAAEATEKPRLALLADAARLAEDRAGAPEKAAALWRTILDEASILGADGQAEAREAAERLDALLESLGEAGARCEVLERRATLETSRAQRAAALQEAARVAQVELGDVARAVDLARRRIELTGGAGDPLALGAIDVVVDGTRALGRWEELVDALSTRATAAASPAAARADRVEAAGVLAGELGRAGDAIDAWKAIAAAHGQDDEVAEALAVLYGVAGREEDLASLLEDEAARATDPRRAAALLVRLGDLRRAQAGYEDALASYRLALETDPACESAADGLRALVSAPTLDRAVLRDVVDALEASYRSAEAWDALVALASARLGVAADEAARVAVLLETAKVLEDRLHDPAGAAERVADALVLEPSRLATADELLRLCRAADAFHAAARVLGGGAEARLLAQVTDPVAVELLRGAAGSAAGDGDDAAAERFALAALSRAPADVDLVERLVRARRSAGGGALVDALERFAMATSRLDVWRDAVDVARDAADPRARALTRSLLELAASRWIADGDDEEARGAAEWAFESLVDLARAAGDDAEVRAAHLRAAELPFEPERRRELALAAASLAPDEESAAILGGLFDRDPADDEVARGLDEVLRRLGRRAELRAAWTRRVDVAPDEATRVAHRRELAELALEDGDAPAAIGFLRKNVEDAADADSFSRLVEVLSAAGRHPELCAALEEHAARLAKRGEAARAARLWERAAEVAETQLRALERAIQARERSLALVDGRSGREALVRLLEQRGHWARAARSLELLLDDALADEGDTLTVRLVDALSRAGDVARAQQILETAAAASDPDSPLRARLLAFYREADLPRPLAALLRESAETASETAAKVALLREAAAIHIQRLDDADGALPLLARAAELDPDDQGTRLVLAEAMRAAGRLDEAASVLEGLLARYGNRRPKERAVVHFELAKLALSGGDRSRSLEELEQAAKIDPAHPEILHALATLALEEGQLLRAQRTFRGLLFVLKPGRTDARSSRSPSRSEVLFELAEIEARNKDVARHAEMVDSAFESAAADPWEAERLLVRLRTTGRADLVARALRTRLSGDLDPAVSAPLVAELAETLAQQGEPREAVEAALRAARLAPRDEAVHRRVAAVLRKHDALDRYRALLDEAVGADAPDLDALLFSARALERELGDDAAAAAALRRADEVLGAGELDEDNATRRLAVSRALEAIAVRAGDRDALVELLESRLEPPVDAVVDEAERVATLRRILALRVAGGGDDDAIAGVCERLVAADDDAEALDADLRGASAARPGSARLARLLEDFARDRDRAGTLVEALIRLAAIEPASAPDLLREAWEVASAAGDDEGTARALELAVEAAPGEDDPALEERLAWALLGLAERRRAGGDLAAAADLWERAAAVADGDEARELTLRAARTAEEALGDRWRAAALYERLREKEPGDRAVWGPLAGCLRALGEESKLTTLLEDTLPLVDDRDARNQVREELARLVRTTDPQRAAALLEEVLDEDPSRWDAASELETLLSSPDRRADRAAFLARRLDAARDAEEKLRVVEIAQRLGALHEELGEDQEAATAYHAGLEWDPEHRGLLAALVELAARRDDPMELTDALEDLLRVETGPGAVAVARRLVAVRDAQGDEPGAHASLLAALRAAPEDRALFTEVKGRFEARGDARALAEALAIGGQVAGDPAERKRSLLEAAAALRDRAGDVPASVELLSQAFHVDPTDRDVLFQLMDARSALGQHALAIEAVNEAMTADPEGDPWLFFSRAVLREGLGDGDGALADLELAFERSGGQYGAELDAQIRTCILRADDVGDIMGARAHRSRLARLQLAQGDLDGASVTLDELVRQDATDVEVLRLLADLLEKLGRWAEAADTWRRLSTLEDAGRLHDLALRFADASVRADRGEDARGALERALALEPQSRPVRDRLRVLYEMLGDRHALAQLELVEAEQETDPVRRAGCLLRGGRLVLDLGDSPETALAAAEHASQLVPGDQDVALLHAEALARVGRRGEAAAVLERALAAHRGRRSPKLALIHRTVGRLALEANEPARALEAFGKAFDADPQNATLALELGALAVQLNELEIAGRAYRSVTLMRAAGPAAPRASVPPPAAGRAASTALEGANPQDKSVAYYQLGCIAYAQRDVRRARLMLEKALDEDPAFTAAREMLTGLSAG